MNILFQISAFIPSNLWLKAFIFWEPVNQAFLIDYGWEATDMIFITATSHAIGLIIFLLIKLLVKKQSRKASKNVLFSLLFIHLFSTVAVFFLFNAYVAFLYFVFRSHYKAFSDPVIRPYFQSFLPHKYRTTLLSIESWCVSLLLAFTGVIEGLLLDFYGVLVAIGFTAFFVFIAGVILLYLPEKNINLDPELLA